MQLNFELIQNDEILLIFQYLQAKYCNSFEIIEFYFTMRRQLTNIWVFSN